MRFAFALAFGAGALASSATTYRTNTVDGLIYLLNQCNGNSHVIQLEAGDYQLRTTDCMSSDNGAYGPSQLYCNKVRIVGLGAQPEDTRLIGAGNMRLIFFTDSNGKIENLTITNGFAKTVADKSSSNRGGGTFNGTITNCLLIGNQAQGYGGASGGSFKAYNCRYIGNSCRMGGAIHGGNVYDSVLSNNYASAEGGAGYNVGGLYGCTIISNRTDGSAGAVSMCSIVSNSLIACNTAVVYAGGLYLYSQTNANKSVSFNQCIDCVISNNACFGSNEEHTGGGARGRDYLVDCYGRPVRAVLRHCTVVGNLSSKYGGGVAACTCEDCLITNNVALSAGGVHKSELHRCRVIDNAATKGYGGIQASTAYDSAISFNRSQGDACGACGDSSVISNCTVYANIASNISANCTGPGLMWSTAYDSEICGNYCFAVGTTGSGGPTYGCAGGAHKSTLYRCFVHDNYSSHFGGGLRESTAYNCCISNNVGGGTGPNSLSANYYHCEVIGSGVYGGMAVRTVFRNIGQPVTPACPHATHTRTSSYVTEGASSMTNCLFVGNVFVKSGGVTTGCIFSGNKDAASSVVNCTVVSNTVRSVFKDYGREGEGLHGGELASLRQRVRQQRDMGVERHRRHRQLFARLSHLQPLRVRNVEDRHLRPVHHRRLLQVRRVGRGDEGGGARRRHAGVLPGEGPGASLFAAVRLEGARTRDCPGLDGERD